MEGTVFENLNLQFMTFKIKNEVKTYEKAPFYIAF